MTDQWVFKSESYDNCNCAVNCGCQFNLPSTYGYCQSAFVGNIVEGHFGDTSLAGLNWAGLYKWPGEIAAGNGQRQIVIDERADDAQRIALETIISGEACAHLSNCFSVFVSACSEFCETLFLPIDLDANFELRTARVDIPGVMKSSGKPIINERGNRARHDIGDRWYRDGVQGSKALLKLQSYGFRRSAPRGAISDGRLRCRIDLCGIE